jgi:hypothetical protein
MAMFNMPKTSRKKRIIAVSKQILKTVSTITVASITRAATTLAWTALAKSAA